MKSEVQGVIHLKNEKNKFDAKFQKRFVMAIYQML